VRGLPATEEKQRQKSSKGKAQRAKGPIACQKQNPYSHLSHLYRTDVALFFSRSSLPSSSLLLFSPLLSPLHLFPPASTSSAKACSDLDFCSRLDPGIYIRVLARFLDFQLQSSQPSHFSKKCLWHCEGPYPFPVHPTTTHQHSTYGAAFISHVTLWTRHDSTPIHRSAHWFVHYHTDVLVKPGASGYLALTLHCQFEWLQSRTTKLCPRSAQASSLLEPRFSQYCSIHFQHSTALSGYPKAVSHIPSSLRYTPYAVWFSTPFAPGIGWPGAHSPWIRRAAFFRYT
jgi:hypothetical protein